MEKWIDRLRQTMQRAVSEKLIAGMNLLAIQDGQELCYCQAGFADVTRQRPFNRDTIFRLYSQTKPVTAAAAMILMERGLIDLQQPVSDFLPAFREQKALADGGQLLPTRPVFIKDLLNMTSGLVYPNGESAAGVHAQAVFDEAGRRLHTNSPMTTLELANALARGPLAFLPGSSWHYGTSADVLGALIETVSGMRFGEFLEKELFAPLGMADTAFWVPKEKRERLANPYETVSQADGTLALRRYTGEHLAIQNGMEKPPAFESGGAGLTSTIDDYKKFAQMLLREGELEGVRILQPRTVRFLRGGQLMACQQKAFEQWIGLEGFSYGNLMRVCKNPGQVSFFVSPGEYGWDGWLGCYFANFPQERLTLLMAMQKTGAGTFSLTRELRNILTGSLPPV